VIGMTFVERQRRALSEIECMLRRTDPCLASKFGMFSRLAVDEGMPSAEQVISGRARRRSGMTRVGQLPCRLRGLLCILRPRPNHGGHQQGSETARRRFAADQVPASPEEKDSRRRSSHADGG
jgi:hypothetical protein